MDVFGRRKPETHSGLLTLNQSRLCPICERCIPMPRQCWRVQRCLRPSIPLFLQSSFHFHRWMQSNQSKQVPAAIQPIAAHPRRDSHDSVL